MRREPDVEDEAVAIEIFRVFVPVTFLESCTCTVKEELLALVGVPVMVPVEAPSASPGGSEPETTLQLYGDVPPVAASGAL
jgi:hypothetical protein